MVGGGKNFKRKPTPTPLKKESFESLKTAVGEAENLLQVALLSELKSCAPREEAFFSQSSQFYTATTVIKTHLKTPALAAAAVAAVKELEIAIRLKQSAPSKS
jgi:hypothetical protein